MMLFNLILENVIRQSGINSTGLKPTKNHQSIAYADDIPFQARSNRELLRIMKKLGREAEKGRGIKNER